MLTQTAEVMNFIQEMYDHFADDEDKQEWLKVHYRYGYCYYFAHILQAAFNRGDVSWTAPYDHYVWVDTDGNAYDCEGLYTDPDIIMIPEKYLPTYIVEYCKHLPGEGDKYADGLSKDSILGAIRNYYDTVNIEFPQNTLAKIFGNYTE